MKWFKLKDKKPYVDQAPLNTGNFRQLETNLNVAESLIRVGMDDVNGVVSEWLSKRNYNIWELMNFQADYWVNLIQFTFKDNYIDNFLYNLIRYCWFYNKVGIIIHEEDNYIPINEYRTELNEYGKPEYIEGFNAIDIFRNQIGIVTPNTKSLKKYTISKKDIVEKKYLRLINPSSINNYLKWSKFCEQQQDILDRYTTLGVLISKKIINKTQDPALFPQELKEFLNAKHPVINNLSLNNGLANKFTSEGLDDISPENYCLYYEKFLKYYYELLGRRQNSDEKGARNLTSEIAATQSNFNNLQNTWILNIKNFLEEFSKITGKQYEILNENELDPNQINQAGPNEKGEKVSDNEAERNLNK